MSSTVADVRAPRVARLPGRRWLLALSALALLVLAAIAAAPLLNEPLRQRMEATLNQHLEGYTVRLPGLELRPLSLSLALVGLSLRQNAHPDPPVLELERLTAGVHWRALLSLRLVADMHVASPRLHVDRAQVVAENEDAVAIEDKGWQDAINSIFPLKFNEVRITNGAMTYIDDPRRPLALTQIEIAASNIRNVRSTPGTFPSPLRVRAAAFDTGRVTIDGAADFLAEPNPAVHAEIALDGVPLDRAAPVLDDVSLRLSGGTLEADGMVEVVGERQHVHLRRATIDGLTLDYVYDPDSAGAAGDRAERVAKATVEMANEPTLRLDVDALRLSNASLGLINENTAPDYRLFFSDAEVQVLNVSNHAAQGRGWVMLQGRLMDSGASDLWMSFIADRQSPDVNAAVQIRDTDMRTMNDLFEAHAGFDVVGGRFSFFTELYLSDGEIEGYVKPLFADVDVYDRRQERGEGLGQHLYEGAVGGLAALLQNRDDRTATQARVRGRSDSPELSGWEIAFNLVRNAFFDAIVPGLEHAAMGNRAALVIGTDPERSE